MNSANSRVTAPDHVTPGDTSIAARILSDVQAYVPTLRSRALETERLRRVPEQTIQDLDAIGVFKMCIPVEHGGYASSPLQQYEVIAEIARGCGSTGWVAWVTLTATQWIGLYDHKAREEVFDAQWVGPLNCGAGNPCAARRVPGGLMVTGRWPFCSGAHHTAFHQVGVFAPQDAEPETLMALIPSDAFTILDDWKVMGMRGSSSNTVVIEDEVFVPDHRTRSAAELFANARIGPPPAGLLFQANIVTLTASLHSAVSVGIARAAMELFKAKIQTRKITGLPYPKQSDAPVTHLQLGDLHCKLQSAELIARNNVMRTEQMAREGKAILELDFKQTLLENAYVMQLACDITQVVLRASGATQIQEDSPFQRLFRDAQVASMHARTQIETAMEEFGKAAVGIQTQTKMSSVALTK